MLLCGSAAVTHETANQSRRDAENTHPMALDERPQTIRPRKIQSSLVKNHRRAEKGCTKNFPRPHHPSHVRHPVKHVLLSDIEAKQHVLRGLDRKTAVRVKRPFRPSGRSRGVNDHQRIFSIGPFRFRLIALLPDLFMPPPVATRSPRNRNPKPPKNEHVLDGGRRAQSLISAWFQKDSLSTPIKAICGQKKFRLAITQASGYRCGAITGKQRKNYSAELDHGKKRRNRLGHHGHEQRSHVALFHAERAQRIR